MIIDFIAIQKKQFEQIMAKVSADPRQYLQFDSIADVYAAAWLKDLPPMCQWYVSGLDDGADKFYLSICFHGECRVFTPYQADF